MPLFFSMDQEIKDDSKELLENVKLHLRVDGEDDDLYISSLILFAKEYLKIAAAASKGKHYDMALKLIVTLMYENRMPAAADIKLANTLDIIIFHMNHAIDEEDEEK